MYYSLIAILIFFSIVVSKLSFRYYRIVWNPILVCMLMITLACCLSDSNIEIKTNHDKLSEGLFWISTGLLFFVCSFFTAQVMKHFKKKYNTEKVYNINFLSKITTVGLILIIVSTLITTYTVVQIAGSFERIFLDGTAVREEYLNRTEGSSLFTMLTVFLSINVLCIFCLFPVALRYKCPHIKVKLVIALLVLLFGSIVTMSKENFIVYCLLFISAYLFQVNKFESEKKFFKKIFPFIIVLIIILIIAISFQRNYIENGRYNSYTESVVGTFQSYIGLPVTAFSVLISIPSPDLGGAQCLRPIINVMSCFGIADHVSIIQNAVKGDVNVYTMFGNMYNDFGFPGIIVLSIIFGFFFGFCFTRGKCNRLSYLVVNSITLMTLFFAYYDLEVIQTIYLFTMIYAVILEKVLWRKLYNK